MEEHVGMLAHELNDCLREFMRKESIKMEAIRCHNLQCASIAQNVQGYDRSESAYKFATNHQAKLLFAELLMRLSVSIWVLAKNMEIFRSEDKKANEDFLETVLKLVLDKVKFFQEGGS